MKTTHTPKELMEMVAVGDRFHRGDDEFARVYKFIERPGRSEHQEPATVVECSMFGAFPDIYEGLEVFALQTDHRAVAIALTTSGWAVPTHIGCETPDCPPSEHPERQRVALLFLLTDDNRQASRLVMCENGQTLDENEGENEGRGQLVEACAMALHFHRADKDHLRELIESTRARLLDGSTVGDFFDGDNLDGSTE